MKRKIYRSEIGDTVLNLIDLRFSVAAVAFMVNRTEANIYAHLRRSDRMGEREVIRRKPKVILDSSMAAMRRLSLAPECAAASILSVPRATTDGRGPLPAFGTNIISTKSGIKVV